MRAAYTRLVIVFAVLLVLGALSAQGVAGEPPTTEVTKARAAAAMDQGIEWLLAQQKADGSFSAVEGMEPAVTSLALRAMATSPSRDELMKTEGFKKALEFILSCIKEDGGVYIKDWAANYHTSVALSALAAINDPDLRDKIDQSQAFLKELQADEGEGLTEDDTSYGGFGYRKGQRQGDMSNLQFALAGLRDSGLTADDAAWGKALAFVERCQNLETDGGFIYRPGESKAGEDPEAPEDETLYRSYASMTYVGLLSMIYCQVDRDDERVQKAVGWLKAHWGFDENYPIGLQGLYYNYHTLARALTAYGERTLADAKGVEHDWYAELVDALATRQHEDGYWVNTEKRWFEDDKILVTTYCLLALAHPYEWYK